LSPDRQRRGWGRVTLNCLQARFARTPSPPVPSPPRGRGESQSNLLALAPVPSPARAGEGCRGSSASRRRGESSVPQGLRPGLPSYAPAGAGNRSALQTIYATSLSDTTPAGECHVSMGAGVRTTFVAPSLVLFRRGLTRGPAPARSVTAGRAGPRAGNGPGTPMSSGLPGARRQKKKSVYF